ncbi:Uncharacterised protein [Mycobacteroides abscessus subsp. massiliense]|nr:Uncharacterised protein [Mycobacteroides abscessus subsp. massiliense]
MARLLIPSDQEDGVIGAGPQDQRDQDIRREHRDANELVVGQERDYASPARQFHHHDQQRQKCRRE